MFRTYSSVLAVRNHKNVSDVINGLQPKRFKTFTATRVGLKKKKKMLNIILTHGRFNRDVYIFIGDVFINSSFMENDDVPRLMGWNLPPEDLIHIPDHWLSYPEVSSLHHYFLAFPYAILMFLGFIGNGLVLWIFCM